MEDFLGLDHVGKSGITRDALMGIRFGVAGEIQGPVELFAEEIPRDDSEPGDHEKHLEKYLGRTDSYATLNGIIRRYNA